MGGPKLNYLSIADKFFRRLVDMAEQSPAIALRHAFPILAVAFFCVSAAWIYNANSRVIDIRDVDEVHTLVWGTESMYRWPPGDVPAQQVGEVSRWFTRILYPFSVYYMNSRMGGEHYVTGWGYPGGFYLKGRLDKGADAPGANELTAPPRDQGFTDWAFDTFFHTVDPNIQDYVFSQRVAFSILAIFSFLLLLRRLYDEYGVSGAAAYAGFVLFGDIVFYQFAMFYSETAFIIVFNLTFYCLLSINRLRTFDALLLGLAAGAAMSTKLTGFVVAAPAFAHVAVGALGRGGRGVVAIAAFFATALSATAMLNALFASPFSWINETLANVYHYKTGHLVTEEGGIEFLLRLVEDIGYPVVALFLASSVWVAVRPNRRDAGLFALIVLTVAVLASVSDSAVYRARNLAGLYVVMSFVIAVGIGRYVASEVGGGGGGPRIAAAFCVAVVVVGAADRVLGIPSLAGVFFERNATRIAECGRVAVIGLSQERFRKFVDREDIVFFERVRGPFNISENPDMLKYPWYFEEYLAYDCVIALRRGQTKQITNYFAPQSHRLVSRVGDLFMFDRGALRRRPVVGI